MTPPGKSAALRIQPRSESADTGAAGFEAAVRNAAAARLRPRPADSAREKLLAFPGFEPSRPVAAPADAASEAAPDLGGELEAALMNDLQSMVAMFDEVARTPADAVPPAPAPMAIPEPAAARSPQAAEPDQEALDRLLASIRQSDRAPRRPVPPTPEPDLDEAIFARSRSGEDEPAGEVVAPVALGTSLAARVEEAPQPKRNPNSPRPNGRDDRLSAPLPRARKPVASPAAPPRIASKAEPVPALRLAIPGARRAYVKPVIAVSLLILLATVGAGMTIRALTARNDTAPTAATAEPGSASSAADVATATPAKTDDTPAAASAPSAPTTIAKTETQPMAATPAAEAPARPAVDNATQHAIPAEMTQPTVMQVAPASTPTVPLQPAVTESEAPVADRAAADSVPAAPTPTETAVTVAKPAAVGGVSATGSLKPGAGRIASGVKLRTNPDNGAPVIAVLGQGTAVQIVSCKGWCEVVAGDKRGFVYQKFLTVAGG